MIDDTILEDGIDEFFDFVMIEMDEIRQHFLNNKKTNQADQILKEERNMKNTKSQLVANF